MSVISQKIQILASEIKNYSNHIHIVTSASGANLGPIGQCHLSFKSGNNCFTDNFIVLKDLQRNLILGLKWQSNYKLAAIKMLMDINASHVTTSIYVPACLE